MMIVIVADDDKMLAVPADILDAGHGERNFTSMRDGYGRRIDASFETGERRSIFVLL
jgi:hypothetical protein